MIRAYRETDADDVVNVWVRASAVAHPFLSPEFQQRERREIRDVHLPNSETWVWESGGRVVGFIALHGSEIGGLFVDPDRQRSGIGRMLVEHARALKGDLEVEVFERNAIGRSFYDRVGFAELERRLDEPSGFEVLRMLLRSGDAATSSIRVAVAADVRSIQRVARETWAFAYEGIIPPAVQVQALDLWYAEESLAEQLDLADHRMLVAEAAGRCVGFAHFVRRGEEAELTRIYVLPAEHGRGIGSALLDEGLRWLRRADVHHLLVDVEELNSHGRAFYEARGFSRRSRTEHAIFGHTLTTVRYDLPVS